MDEQKKKIDQLFFENGLHPDNIDLPAEIKRYIEAMRFGLENPDAEALLMLPTYITGYASLPVNQTAIAIDAGGTNLRVAKIRFLTDNRTVIEEFYSHPMPGSLCRVTAEMLFDSIAEYTEPMLTGDDAIGFCFSYLFEPTVNRDGIIHSMSKEVDVSGIKGIVACEALEAALLRRGLTGTRRYAMLNDTVSSLLGGCALHDKGNYKDFAGMVFGTGCNACYYEKTENITKISASPKMRMIVNMEAGVYNGFAQSTIDKAIDRASIRPGKHIFEKMIAGGYFGDVIFGTLKILCAEGLFSDEGKRTLLRLGTVSLKTITAYINKTAGIDNIYQRVADADEQDRQTLDYVLDLLYQRAAKMLMTMVAAMATKTGNGDDPERPFCVCAEGTTFFKSPLLLQHLDNLILQFAKKGCHIRFVQTEDVILIGTALAALL